MRKSLLIGVAALAVLTLWLAFMFNGNSRLVSASFVAPAYADVDDYDGGGGRGCTDSCLYDANIATCLPAWAGYCQTGLCVKHKEYDADDCCCHEVDSIWVEITTATECTCDVPWKCEVEGSYLGDPCGYTQYVTPIFLLPNDTTFYYKFWDHADDSNCVCSGSFVTDCW